MATLKKSAEDIIFNEAIEGLRLLESKGIFSEEDIDAILKDEKLILEDLVDFVDIMSNLTPEYIDQLATRKALAENSELLEQAVMILSEMNENGELSDDDIVNILEDDDLSIDDIREFLEEDFSTERNRKFLMSSKLLPNGRIDPAARMAQARKQQEERRSQNDSDIKRIRNSGDEHESYFKSSAENRAADVNRLQKAHNQKFGRAKKMSGKVGLLSRIARRFKRR